MTEFDEFEANGWCVLRDRLPKDLVARFRAAFWPVMLDYLAVNRNAPNRGPHRHFLPMPFHPPCFAPEFFFDPAVLAIVRRAMDDRVVADQWGCDVPIAGSVYQEPHIDYSRPLFAEEPELRLPAYMLVASFGLRDIGLEDGPIEIAPGTHRLPRSTAVDIPLQPVLLRMGDVLIRHPWALHRGTPNLSGTPRPLVTIRYVRRWYCDGSREVNAIPPAVWEGLTEVQRDMMRFPAELH